MKTIKTYETFPVWMPLLSNIISLSIYVIGALILAGFGTGLVVLYVLYCVGVEVRVMKKSCVDCYYYGKDCGIGKGRLCALLFKKGEPSRFSRTEVSWVALLPDFLVPIFPLVGGIVLLIRNFSLRLAALVAILLLFSTAGNAAVRSLYACKYCKQRELGCSAEKLFSKG
jgi:hypothetical protein